MQKIIVADASCLILLKKIGQIDLLQNLFGRILITPEVAEEFKETLPDFIEIRKSQEKNYQRIIQTSLDIGEASVIALALEYENSLLIIDELKGRIKAKSLGLNVTGTLGILFLAKEKGRIESLKTVFDAVDSTNFRISKKLTDSVLKRANE
jgi:predicted nucleic acid-binding protein